MAFDCVSLVIDGQPEYYLCTENDENLIPMLLLLLCYDWYYFQQVIDGLEYNVYTKKYEKRDYTKVTELIRKMNPDFINPLIEKHKDDIFD